MARFPDAPGQHMPAREIQAVLLDYGGVIAEEGFRNELAAMAREQGLAVQAVMQVARHEVYATGFVLGTGTEAAFWEAMRRGSGLRGSDAEMTRRVLEAFMPRPWMIEHVRRWRAHGLQTAILSDQTHWLDWLDARDGFFAEFDQVYNSYYLGKGKRDVTLFHDIAVRLALPPASLLFVDDLVSNVERARAAGWQAIVYEDRASFEEAIRQPGLLKEYV